MEQFELSSLSGIDGSFLDVGQQITVTSTPKKAVCLPVQQELIDTPNCKEGSISNYKCPQCPYKTSRIYNFRRHRRTHSKTKQFKCQECQKGFVDQNYLKLHVTTNHGHDGGKPTRFLCDDCGRNLSSINSLQRHQLKLHLKGGK